MYVASINKDCPSFNSLKVCRLYCCDFFFKKKNSYNIKCCSCLLTFIAFVLFIYFLFWVAVAIYVHKYIVESSLLLEQGKIFI